MLGIDPYDLLTNKCAQEQGLVDSDLNIDGILPDVKDFQFPEMTPMVFGPPWFHGFMRKHLIQRPECDDEICRLCGECWEYCPAHAISHDKKRLSFNYDTCIRCYCCIEVCPYGALRACETAMGAVFRKVLRIN
jgi:ferredoxin